MRALFRLAMSLVTLGSFGAACAPAEGQPAAAKASGLEGPLVLELFTSQGCSSCPPADKLLTHLATTLVDRPVAPLSFHVDYWNDLGWNDPYSLPAWTERQRQYADALGDNRVYTPELVVGGAAGFVGSNSVAILKAIEKSPRPALLPIKATWARDHVDISATAPSDADVLVAVWDDDKTIDVTRGENRGERLHNDRVVRRLERVAAAGAAGTVTIKLDPRWKAGAVAFAQRRDKRIVASAWVPR